MKCFMQPIDAAIKSVPGVVIIDNAAYYKIGNQYHPVIGVVKFQSGKYFPMVDLPMMSDEKWNELAKRHPIPKEDFQNGYSE